MSLTLSFFVSGLMTSKESDKDEPEPNLYILLCPFMWFYFLFINPPAIGISVRYSWKKAAVR